MISPVLFAEETGLLSSQRFWEGFAATILWVVLALGLLLLAVKIMDLITPRLDIQVELGEKKNVAVAIVVAATILGVSYIVGQAIVG
jgi:uncharacterized membrane protein YjfL (UPF0719 family)